MHTVEVSNLSKSFGALRAVADVSFSVASGEIFGLLGPNGAGKTTTIRLMLDILKPDSGTVSILNGSMKESKKVKELSRGMQQKSRSSTPFCPIPN